MEMRPAWERLRDDARRGGGFSGGTGGGGRSHVVRTAARARRVRRRPLLVSGELPFQHWPRPPFFPQSHAMARIDEPRQIGMQVCAHVGTP